jgi:NADH-quinone oxidoreductase E subunit
MADQHNEDFKQFNVDLWKFDGHEGALIPLLQSAQDTYGYVPEKAMHYISNVTGIPAAEIYGVVTFYAQFRTRPLGKNIIRVCNGTACHVNGVKMLYNTLQEELGINYEETTNDGVFSLVSVACLGCCSLAPVLTINGEVFGRLTAAKTRKIIRDFKTRTKATEQ